MKKMYGILYLFTHKENLHLKSYLFVSKIGINAFIEAGLCEGGGGGGGGEKSYIMGRLNME